jgi:hypothetical protein
VSGDEFRLDAFTDVGVGFAVLAEAVGEALLLTVPLLEQMVEPVGRDPRPGPTRLAAAEDAGGAVCGGVVQCLPDMHRVHVGDFRRRARRPGNDEAPFALCRHLSELSRGAFRAVKDELVVGVETFGAPENEGNLLGTHAPDCIVSER